MDDRFTIALVGNPNAGKSALFNALTGAHQKVGNYPGVTVERKLGRLVLPDGRMADLVDLPGTYSLDAKSPDEQVTRNVVFGHQEGERRPDLLVIVVDAANLDNHLRFALELIALGSPCILALNMVDLATRDGLELDATQLATDLGVPVIPTVAVRRRGLDDLKAAMVAAVPAHAPAPAVLATHAARDADDLRREARRIAQRAIVAETPTRRITAQIDRIVLHPLLGPLILLALLFVIFQAVFAWSEAPIAMIEAAFASLQAAMEAILPEGFVRDLIVQGVINGVGSVVVFLPQILILFFFILMLEATGYMTRAAFLMDGLMARVGLSGRAFIPLLSSFACAIPGIMATRTISDPKDRLTTILIAPLMTCSARLPVYTLIIAAFIPSTTVWGGVGLQGLVLFALYVSGIIGAVIVAMLLRMGVIKGPGGSFLMELPKYQMPMLRDVIIGLWQRAWIFLRRAGTIIFGTTIVLWLLLSFPKPPAGSSASLVEYSAAGRIASVIEPVLRPVGFNHEIALALIPAMAAREVAVSALATANAIEASEDEDETARTLGERLQGRWSLPTALAFLAWFVFAPQCLSTIAVARRETNGWRWPLFMTAYLFGLAWLAAGATYWTAVAFGL
ncbi:MULTISPECIES: ferrous iron transporter B [unclassified Sphingobium]|uniref:ferrous iron transporter B n=1 Tax=unclassified Sphingobium TaxID=2611147 RepID=UPI00222554F2|nr:MULTISPECIES: ferrous iron transporter B [unclassified Sphingobium]MCW2348913.1 ferrous iron transport protein B [Sphingobium sp. B12D2B]MCW2368040.1 ferrous iron transport protein B [Sphingobium sp. B11D3D]